MTGAYRWLEWGSSRVDGERARRLMLILSAPGCEYARNDGGCTNCSFPRLHGTGAPVTKDDLLAQLEAALATAPRGEAPLRVDLFNSGSFFNPGEIPEEAQRGMLARLAAVSNLKRVLVESRPSYVTAARVKEAADAVGSGRLEIGIGLESASEEIRERRIRKGFTWEEFARAAEEMRDGGARLMVYVLLKPMDTTEAEAIDDSISTIGRIFELSSGLSLPARVALEPCFVGPGTVLEAAFREGRYRPPWLWSVIEVLRRTAGSGEIQVGLSDEGLAPEEVAHNCGLCSARIREALARFNDTGDLAPLLAEDCPCRSAWAKVVREDPA
jgi:radical SAM enzyme (TIGR01210 family)